MEFKDLVQLRRSHRKFTAEEIDADDVKLILRAGLMAPTSKGQRAWQFVVVDDKTDLEKLADAKDMGGQFLKDAPLAIVVLGDPMQNDCWIEDGSIAAISMQYQIEALGLGSCWIQMRGRGLSAPVPTPLFRVCWIFLRTCRASASWLWAIRPTSANPRMRTS